MTARGLESFSETYYGWFFKYFLYFKKLFLILAYQNNLKTLKYY
jgi:hypothetical protein